MRSDGAVMARALEYIKEGSYKFTYEPCDEEQRWCLSLPVSRRHVCEENAVEDARQLAEWYKKQIELGNASINRDLLFDRKPFHVGKACCKDNLCQLSLYPERYATSETSEVKGGPELECGCPICKRETKTNNVMLDDKINEPHLPRGIAKFK